MINILRSPQNPILTPAPNLTWEKEATFNPSVVMENHLYHMLYRAQSPNQLNLGINMKLSTIGHALSRDGVNFSSHRLLIKPEYDWEIYGCEDPRVTYLDDKYYIFYTALSSYPFTPPGIRIGVAVTSDFKNIDAKFPVTIFNSKAMALFPERIMGKIAAILTVHTDMPPAKICLALFDREEEIWSRDYWSNWYEKLDSRVIGLLRSLEDQVEVGAVPLWTEYGWLLIYSYIRNYRSNHKIFGIETALLDLDNPQKVVGRSRESMMVPELYYELNGQVDNVIFPSGAIIEDNKVSIYYGAADTTCCLASCSLIDVLAGVLPLSHPIVKKAKSREVKFTRFEGNPIISPIHEHKWESKLTFNPAAVYAGNKVHLLYRAMGDDNTSVMGYASSLDGIHFTDRSAHPVYTPREDFEIKKHPGDSGCEDPRITELEGRFYMCYTAFNGTSPWKVALTSISIEDFLAKNWNWNKPVLISPPDKNDKNTCIFSEKIKGNYVFLHRFDPSIWIDYKKDLNFGNDNWLRGQILLQPRVNSWDSEKIGIASPPLKTEAGWLLIYHGLSKYSLKYRLGAVLLDLHNPSEVINRLDYPILEPEYNYENKGLRPGTVFACGAVVIKDQLYIYYGGADQFVAVAWVKLEELLDALESR